MESGEMTMLLAVIQVTIAVVLLAAAGGKLVRTEELAGAVRLSGVPSRPATVVARAVPAAEIAVALALLTARGDWTQPALVAASILVISFTAWLVWVRVRRLDIRCNCFGASSRKVTGVAIARNGMLVAATAAGAVLAGSNPTRLPDLSVLWIMTVICVSATVLLLAAFNQIRPQLILSMESLQHRRKLGAGIET